MIIYESCFGIWHTIRIITVPDFQGKVISIIAAIIMFALAFLMNGGLMRHQKFHVKHHKIMKSLDKIVLSSGGTGTVTGVVAGLTAMGKAGVVTASAVAGMMNAVAGQKQTKRRGR